MWLLVRRRKVQQSGGWFPTRPVAEKVPSGSPWPTALSSNAASEHFSPTHNHSHTQTHTHTNMEPKFNLEIKNFTRYSWRDLLLYRPPSTSPQYIHLQHPCDHFHHIVTLKGDISLRIYKQKHGTHPQHKTKPHTHILASLDMGFLKGWYTIEK